MRRNILLGSALFAISAMAACGGSTAGPGGSSSGGAAGMAGLEGGAGSPVGGSGGSISTGGAGGMGTGAVGGTGVGGTGVSGTGGVGGGPTEAGPDAPPSCAPPTRPSDAALCLGFEPEPMTFEAERALDGKGVLIVEVYDTPNPDSADGGSGVAPIAARVFPDQPSDGGSAEVSITALPRIRFDALPAGDVYVRTIFVDNPAVLVTQKLSWGVWIGGLDLSGGFSSSMPIQPVALFAGRGTSVGQPLTALRRLRVSLSLASGTQPLDDGQGPATVAVWRTATPSSSSPFFGYGKRACADVAAGSAVVPGFVIGSAAFYLSAELDDFNVGGAGYKPGDLASLAFSAGVPSLPAQNRVVVGPTQYSVTHAVQLNYVVPLGDAGAPPPYACVGLDAGSD